MAGRELTVRILGDSAAAEKAFKRFGASVDESADRIEGFGKRTSHAGDRIKDFGRKATVFATLPIAAAMGYATKAASALGEQVSKTDNVFGDAADTVHKFAKGAARDVGLSQRAAETAVGTFGNLFNQLGIGAEQSAKMGIGITRLAADLASFHDVAGGAEEVTEAITSAFRGEYDAVQKFIPTINAAAVEHKALEMGLAATTKALDDQDKALAVNALLTEGAGKAAGDFDRTAGSLANQQRILKAEFEDTAAQLGTKLIPVALKVAQVAGSMLSAFSSLPPELQNLALLGAAAVAAVGPLSLIAGNVAKAVGSVAQAVNFLATSTAVAKVAFTGLGLAVGGAAVGFLAYRTYLDALKKADEEFNKEAATTVNNTLLLESATDKTTDAFKKQAVALYVHGSALHSNADEAEGAAVNAKLMKDELERGRAVLDKLASSTGVSKERIVELANSMGVNLGTASDEARAKVAGALAEISRGITPTERLAEVQETLGSKTATATEQFDAFKTAIDAALGSVLSEREAAIALAEKVEALGLAIQENGTKTGVATEQQRNLTSSLIDVVRAAEQEVEAITKSGQISTSAADQKAALVERLEAVKRKYPQLAPAIQEYINKINSIPDTATTTAVMDTSKAVAEIRRYAELVNSLQQTMGGSLSGKLIPKFHSGGVVPGRPGQEVPAILQAGETVIPRGHGGTATALAPAPAAPIHITVPVTVQGSVVTQMDIDAGVIRALDEWVRRNGWPRNWRAA